MIVMSGHKIYVPAAMASWSLRDVQRLRGLAEAGASMEELTKTLDRSASAIRNKAGLHGISLARSSPAAPSFVRPPDPAQCESSRR